MTPAGTASIGVIVNPIAGKDIRRLSSGASHTPDTAKIGIVRRVFAAAIESGARELVLADDPHRLAKRALEPLDTGDVSIVFTEAARTGTRFDTIGAASEMARRGVRVLVALGGDGTCRDVATGWQDAPLIAISTGTNNVYPAALDGTSAGVAAGLIASGRVPLETVSATSKCIHVAVIDPAADDASRRREDLALVDLALIATTFVGARAVRDPASIRSVIAAIGHPASTGLSAIAGRTHPVDRSADGGVHLTLGRGPAGRCVRVPLTPGSFDDVDIACVRPVADGEQVILTGPGVLAFDGERDMPIGAGTTVTATIERDGPRLVDVIATITDAAQHHLFDHLDQHAGATDAN